MPKCLFIKTMLQHIQQRQQQQKKTTYNSIMSDYLTFVWTASGHCKTTKTLYYKTSKVMTLIVNTEMVKCFTTNKSY